MAKGTCTIDGCDRIERCAKVCDMHYQRLRRCGSAELPATPTNEELFWAKVNQQAPPPADRPELGSCWTRNAWVNSDTGYAFWQVGRHGKTTAHRYSYELVYGSIPPELHIDHLCRVRTCVRPSHLEAVTPAENARRAASVRIRKTHCPKGHEYAGANLYVTGKNQHVCRICRDASRRAFNERRKAAAA